jgi:hypothetical protein
MTVMVVMTVMHEYMRRCEMIQSRKYPGKYSQDSSQGNIVKYMYTSKFFLKRNDSNAFKFQ